MYIDRHISPFEGSSRAGAAEYVKRGDVYNFFLLFKIIVVPLPNFNENYIWQFTKRTTTDLIDTKTPSS